ncbi:hypothetical protein GWI33_011391 [Rhynchophorus ferrugineus]|uniref:Uncharacterized protein n=1 Tax=Rhynchophorus ferrugineus TaxID=354439 RepID=A0A834IUG2_RHYFE|nr:hypothetical protein GWI33_011391 [Rhynchophorus ferrugineus]
MNSVFGSETRNGFRASMKGAAVSRERGYRSGSTRSTALPSVLCKFRGEKCSLGEPPKTLPLPRLMRGTSSDSRSTARGSST